MSMGLVDDSSFDAELKKLSPKSGPIKPDHGRSEGDNNVPESLRKIIGETAVIDGRKEALSIATAFGISASSVSAYAKGATSTSTYNSPKASILQHINKSRKRAIKRASSTLNSALSAISQEKLDYSDAKDLSTIAKDMSVIIKNLEPPSPINSTGESSMSQYVIYAPTFRDERSFETINVTESE